jgi:hypothetical protein
MFSFMNVFKPSDASQVHRACNLHRCRFNQVMMQSRTALERTIRVRIVRVAGMRIVLLGHGQLCIAEVIAHA